jgi:outer membrane protein TolC
MICAVAVLAQDSPVFPTASYFRQRFYTPDTRVELQPPARLSDFLAEGKLELSLRSYLELVMANNTDIAIQRISIEPQRNAITRAYGRFDPALSASFTSTRANSPASDLLAGAATVSQLTQPAVFNYQQILETGTQYSVGFSGSKIATNSSFATFNPSLTARLSLGFTQPLLRGRGMSITRLPVLIARSRLRSGEQTVRDQLLRLLALAETAYWDLVEARENVKVQEQSVALRGQALKIAERELELGALSQLDIYQPRADYASAEIQLSQARYRLAQSEDALRRQIGADLDPKFRLVPIVLTETVLPPDETFHLDREELVGRALATRPDLQATLENLQADELNLRGATDGLRPDLSLTGNYASSGRGGIFYDRSSSLSGQGGGNGDVVVIPGGFGDALSQMFNFNYPTYTLGLNLRLPIRDRAASANLADALVQKRLDTLRQRSLEQLIRLEVLNAVSQVESSREAVKLATVARDLAQKNLEAEQKKYELGTTVLFFVLDAQTRLTTAQSRLLFESVSFRRNQLSLLRSTGELLEARGVKVQ